ncbi:MAG TPA: phenylalanine--tRNA ligase subunit beta, partial [Thermoplasmata archaeon]|nr:phenylalanine--tRNA ligase subunit beta [Thermoplasmata archaeon]
MPAVKFTMEELRGLSGIHDVEDDALIDAISMIGADYQGFYDGVLEFEFFPDRPDLFSVEGVARALRHYLGGEVRHHPVSRGDIVMTADPTVRDVRPYVVGGVVRGVSLDGDAVLSLMSLQEKLHATIGRDRRKVAIGVHDLDRVVPPFTYTAIAPDSLSFVPLGHTEPMTPEEILRRHEKGLAYAHILEGVDRCPMILDSNGDVLSFPPVINGALTTVTTETRNVFIDCTGTSLGALRTALNIVATSLAERGGSIESIEVAPSGD